MGISMTQIETKFFIPKEHVGAVNEILEDLDEFSWNLTRDEEGNIIDIDFEGEKYYQTIFEELCQLAPYVKDGSYIHCCADHDHFRYYFLEGSCTEQEAKIVFLEE